MNRDVSQAHIGMAPQQGPTEPGDEGPSERDASLTEPQLNPAGTRGIERIRVITRESAVEHAGILKSPSERLFAHLDQARPLSRQLKRIYQTRLPRKLEDD